jgi:hypothetical protein
MLGSSRTSKWLLAIATLFAAAIGVAAHTPWGERDAHAYIRGGYVGVPGDGGVVAVSRTTWIPGVGVSRGVAVGGRYLTMDPAPDPPLFRPPAVVAGRPGVNHGSTARGIRVGAIYAGPSTGAYFRFGPYVRTLPAACTTIFWMGAAAYRCGASTYVYDMVDGAPVYYPVVY